MTCEVGAPIGSAIGVGQEEADEYLRAYLQSLPPGELDNLNPDGLVYRLLRGLCYEQVRIEIRARDLIDEQDPRTTIELLPDWERSYGLPAKCGTPPTTLSGRRAALLAKMTSKQAGTEPFYLELAAKLGYPNAEFHQMYRPFRCGSRCGDALYGTSGGWVDTFLILPNATTENDGTLQCLVRLYKQGHEIAIFEAPEGWEPPEE